MNDLELAINELYEKCLKRKADSEGLKYYQNLIENKKINLTELEKMLLNSDESKIIFPFGIQNVSDIPTLMKDDWNERAKNLCFYSIATDHSSNEKTFWESGYYECHNILGIGESREQLIFNQNNSEHKTALEIGCGIGRILFQMSGFFESVIGVDVSEEMILKGEKYLKNYTNCKMIVNDGSSLSFIDDSSVDFCYSFIVFQHIPDKEIIEKYFAEIYRILTENGVFRFQVWEDTKNDLHEPNTWSGVKFTVSELHKLAEKYNFHIFEEERNSPYYWMTLTKTSLTNFNFVKPNYKKIITELYEKFLLRKPDKEGLEYFISKLNNNEINLRQLRIEIFNSEEAKSIRNFSHYTDKYWNNIDFVKKYKNKLSTDDEGLDWISDIKNRFPQYVDFNKVLIVGCGNGWLERRLHAMGIGKIFDAFDISEEYLKESNSKKGNMPINYFIDDINNLQNIKINEYDAIFNFAILHHCENLDGALNVLSKALKPNGLMFNEEYVGPSRNQYSDEHLEILHAIMNKLPSRLHSKYELRPNIENFRVEPSEAIHSDQVQFYFRKYFDLTFERNLNGGIAYPILWNNIEYFQDDSDAEARKWLEYLLEQDVLLSHQEKVPILFWYGVGKSKIF